MRMRIPTPTSQRVPLSRSLYHTVSTSFVKEGILAMSERSSRVADGFVRSFRDIVDRVDPQDLVLELVQRRILPPSYLERQPGERRREVMMKLLGRVYRQSLVDNSTYADFVSALDGVNTRDPGHRYEDIIQELGHANSEIEPLDEVCPCHHLPFSEVERRVFDCTRRVAERCLEPDSVLPDLVSAGTISFEACMEVAEREDRLERVHHLMETILSGGSQALGAFVRTLLDSDDRSASGVGHVMHECLEAHRESPYTLPEWLEHVCGQRERSAESEAFQRAYADIFSLVSECDPQLTIVNHLYSSGLLDRSTRDTVTEPRGQRVDQIRCLLAQLEGLIETQPGVYRQLVDLLQQEETCWLNHVGRLLEKSYDKQLGEDDGGNIVLTERDSCLPQVSTEMRSYQEEVQRAYTPVGGQEGMEEKWPGKFIKEVVPTNLARITREKVYQSTADAFTQTTLHGNIDEIDQSKTPIVKECLFEGGCRCVVAQGAAGIGKSIFTQEIAHDWAAGKGSMRDFKLLYLVPLRSTCFHEVSTVFDLLHPKPSKSVEREIASSEGEGLLFVLDGFDELPEPLQGGNSVYGRLISGQELPKARILITTRPKAVGAIERLTGPGGNKHVLNVEILGFQMQNIESCIQCMLSEEAHRKAFLRYIEENVVIKNMMYIPLHTAIVIELFKQRFLTSSSENLDTRNCALTLTELFRDLCRCLIYRDIASNRPDSAPLFEDLQLESLPSGVKSSFQTLCSHAFHSLSQQKLIFDKIPANFDHLGFMRSITVQGTGLFAQPRLSFSFHHLTIQEFLAAFHLSHLQPPEARLEMVQELPTDHQNMVLRFLAGLSRFRQVGWPQAMESVGICLDSQGNRGCNSTLLNCLFEAQDPSACQEVFPSGHTINYSPMTSTQFDCFALGYCIAHSGEGCQWKLCGIGGRDISAIAAGMRSVDGGRPQGRIHLIKLSYGGENIHNLGLLPGCVLEEIRELNLSNCGLNNEACAWLSKFLPSLSSLQQLDLGDNPFTGGSAGSIFVGLSKLSGFQYLDLLHAQLNETDIEALRVLVRRNGTLKNLIIGRCQMPPSLVEKMVDVILSNSCLKSISFMNIDFPRLATHLASRLEANTTLESIMLWDRSFCTDGALRLLRCLETNKTLASMTLMPWYEKNIPEHILARPSVGGRVQWFIYPKRKKP